MGVLKNFSNFFRPTLARFGVRVYLCPIIHQTSPAGQNAKKMATFQTVTVKAEQGFQNRLTGRANSSAVFLLNAAGDVAFLPGSESPYSPIGGRWAFASCIAQGCLVFKPYAFPAGVSVGKPIKLNVPGNAPG